MLEVGRGLTNKLNLNNTKVLLMVGSMGLIGSVPSILDRAIK